MFWHSVMFSDVFLLFSFFFPPIGESMPSTSRVFRCFGTEKTVSDKMGVSEKGHPWDVNRRTAEWYKT